MSDAAHEWEHVRLGDVVDVVTDYWDRDATIPERFVAGEHIDEGDLRIRRWGMTNDELVPPTFNRRFRAGDVLFHSRNLKKLASPDFAGITGEKLFILRSRDEARLIPQLLPFVLQTARFDAYVNQMWAGSTNKFLNKAPLVKYEFVLPPRAEQKRLVQAFASVRLAIESLESAVDQARALYESLSMSLFTTGVETVGWDPKKWARQPLRALVKPDAPICYGIVQVGPDVEGGVPTLAIRNLTSSSATVHRTAANIETAYSRSRIESNDVLVAIKATIGPITKVPDGFSGNISRDLARIRLRDDILSSDYFLHLWRTPAFRRYFDSRVVGSTRAELSIAALRELRVPVPTLNEQAELVQQLAAVEQAIESLLSRREDARDALRALLANTLGDRGA